MFDVLVVGSGPAGVQALAGLSRERLRIGLIDPGKAEERYSELIPDEPFASNPDAAAGTRRGSCWETTTRHCHPGSRGWLPI